MKKIIILGITVVIILVLILFNKNIRTKKIDTSVIPSPTVYISIEEKTKFYYSDYPVQTNNDPRYTNPE